MQLNSSGKKVELKAQKEAATKANEAYLAENKYASQLLDGLSTVISAGDGPAEGQTARARS